MLKLRASLAGLCLGASGAVWAQAAAPASSASQPAKAPTTEAQAAMERAQRLAANPMKVILQASKIRRRPNEGEPEPADPNILRRTAVRAEAPAAAPPPPQPRVAAAPAPAPTTTAPAPTTTAQAAPPPTSAAPAPEPPAPNKTMPTALAAGSGAGGPVPAIEPAPLVDAAPPMAKAVAPTALPVVAPAAQPTLVTMVDPEIPVRLMADGSRIKEIFADLQLRADGSVAEVKLVPPVPRGWQPYIIGALERWRFEPLPSARTHRVQLVFDER